MSSIYEPGPPPRSRKITGTYGRVVLVLACLALGLFVATQYVAYRFGFHPNLGPSWLVLPSGSGRYFQATSVLLTGGLLTFVILSQRALRRERVRRWGLPGLAVAGGLYLLGCCPVLYSPTRYMGWAIAYDGWGENSPYLDLFNEGLLAGGIAFVLVVTVLIVARRGSRTLRSTGSHGTAAWSDGRALMTGRGLMIGRKSVGASGASRLLRYDGEGHLITVAPTRSGKGVGGVMPNLLSYPGSVVVTDPKGENYAVTARFRRSRLGQEVYALDPFDQLGAFGLVPSSDAFNPMDLMDPEGEDLLESAGLLADMLVLPPGGGGGEETFWTEEAKALLAGLILFVAVDTPEARAERTRRAEERLQVLLDEEDPKGRAEVRRRAEDIQEARGELKARKRQEKAYQDRTLMEVRRLLTLPKHEFGLLMTDMLQCPGAGGMVARAAARHTQKADKERSGVISTAQSHTHFLDSPRMASVLRSSESLRLSDLKRRGMSLYLILPAHYLDTYSRWLRLMIACALHELARTPGKPKDRVLFLLDEFSNLGRMNPVLRAVSLLAGYGVSIWMFLQDLSQLKGTYPEKWGTFLANADVFQAFSANDYDTARYLSDLTGDASVYVEAENQSLSRSRGRHISRGQGSSQTFSEKARKLLLPDEVRRLPQDRQLLFVKGMEPLMATKINYLYDPEFFESDPASTRSRPPWRRRLERWGIMKMPPDRYRPIFDDNPMFMRADVRREEGKTAHQLDAPAASRASLARIEHEMDLMRSVREVPGWADSFRLGLSDPDLPLFLRDEENCSTEERHRE